jgi:hypothetical protein
MDILAFMARIEPALEGRHGSRHEVGDCSAVTVVHKESELNETVVLREESY